MRRASLLALVAGLVLASSSLAGGRAETEVEFDFAFYDDVIGNTTYGGTISSPRKACLRDRKVFVYRRAVGEPDAKIGHDRAERDGEEWEWRVVKPNPPLAGDYYARAKSTDECKGDKSNIYEFN